MITITAPKKGLGQTVTAINIAINIGNILKDKVLLIDINQYCYSIEDYLSNTKWTRGLDEFKNNILTGIGLDTLDSESWCKGVTPRLNIMASNHYFHLDKGDIEQLQYYSKKVYPVTLIDTIAGKNDLTDLFIDESKVILVILNQDRSLIRLIKDKNLYGDQRDKVIFVVNRYLDQYDNVKVKYDIKELTLDLVQLGYSSNQIINLPFDAKLLNECNDGSLLNYGMIEENGKSLYHHQVELLAIEILKKCDMLSVETNCHKEIKKKTIFNFFNF